MTEANITWVTEQVATGGDLSFSPRIAAQQFSELLEMDIDLVIDCRIEDNDAAIWAETDVEYLHLPVDDIYGSHLPQSHFDAAVGAARPVLEAGGKVFVHCHMGINRGPSTAYALLLDQKMPATRAFDLIRKKRPEAAIYYAEDALQAHLARRGISLRSRPGKERMILFKNHLKRVFGPKEREQVRHIIRQNHERDQVERMAP